MNSQLLSSVVAFRALQVAARWGQNPWYVAATRRRCGRCGHKPNMPAPGHNAAAEFPNNVIIRRLGIPGAQTQQGSCNTGGVAGRLGRTLRGDRLL